MSESTITLVSTSSERPQALKSLSQVLSTIGFEGSAMKLLALSLYKRIHQDASENAINAKLNIPAGHGTTRPIEVQLDLLANAMKTLRSQPVDRDVDTEARYIELDNHEIRLHYYIEILYLVYVAETDHLEVKITDMLTCSGIDTLNSHYCQITPSSLIITPMLVETETPRSVDDLLSQIEDTRRTLRKKALNSIVPHEPNRLLHYLSNIDHSVTVLETAMRSGEKVCPDLLGSLYAEFDRLTKRIRECK